MFTGLVAGTGQLKARVRRGQGYRLSIAAELGALALGESVAVSGACLTVVSQAGSSFDADVSLETAEKTTLGALATGALVNLERALRLGDRLGGHWVSGHVDAVAKVSDLRVVDEAWSVTLDFPPHLRRFIAAKGSVTLDGVSLTVNEVHENRLAVMLIPHTRAVTTLRELAVGSSLNLEVDSLARYVASYLDAQPSSGMDADQRLGLALERFGFK